MNRTVLFAALFIGLVGGLQAFMNHGKLSRVLIGTYVLLLLLALVDAIGGAASQLASALALLAALYAGLTQAPWQQLLRTVNG
jgi:uncharacterized membrane protein